MKSSNYIVFFALLFFISASSCTKEEIKNPGTVSIIFDIGVGDDQINLRDPGDQTFDFTDANGQQFNISKFGYYISEIKFSSPDGVGYADPRKITVDPSKITGFYHVLASDPASQIINIENVTARAYDKVEFTIGVKSYTVIPGPPGGILDPANGAWFLNMDIGYVNLAIEGNASNSGQEYSNPANGPEILEGTFSIHTSGWKDVDPEPGEEPILVDNTRTIVLELGELINVEEGLKPEVHVHVDLAKILEGIDFSETFAVERPDQGLPFANTFEDAFIFDFITQ